MVAAATEVKAGAMGVVAAYYSGVQEAGVVGEVGDLWEGVEEAGVAAGGLSEVVVGAGNP